MTKYTQVHERVFSDNTVVGHAVPRCMMWDDGHGVQTSIVKLQKGKDLGWHRHETWVQVFILSGALHCTLDDRTCRPGDYYFVEPGDEHCETALEESEIMIIKAMPNEQYPIAPPPLAT